MRPEKKKKKKKEKKKITDAARINMLRKKVFSVRIINEELNE